VIVGLKGEKRHITQRSLLMKKIVLIVLVLAVVCGSVFAFDILSYPPPISGGNILLDVGSGFLLTGYPFGKFGIPPLFLNAEMALPIKVPLSVGLGGSFFQWKRDEFLWGYTQTFITPQARVNWHWGLDVSWLDLYTGASIGYTIVTTKWRDANQNIDAEGSSGLFWNAQVGAHFYFTKNIGAVVEAGYPFLVKGGLALKFAGPSSGTASSGRNRIAGGSATVTTDVNLRSGPSTDFPVLRALPEGTTVTLTGEISDGWTQVTYNGQTGWVSSPYLTTVRG
jgi:hypothetical protein